MKKFFVEGHRVVDFEVTVFAENEDEARSKVMNRKFSDEEMDSFNEPWPQDSDLEVDHVQEVKRVKQSTLSR
jgi:hypothetical protein